MPINVYAKAKQHTHDIDRLIASFSVPAPVTVRSLALFLNQVFQMKFYDVSNGRRLVFNKGEVAEWQSQM